MRTALAIAIAALAAACVHHDRAADEAGNEDPRERHPCDPKGAEVARFEEPPDLEKQLFPDELALRGRCTPRQHENAWRVEEMGRMLEREANQPIECTGACEPMHAGLPAFDEKHDLEDETLQRECTGAVGKLDAKIRAACRHVCLVDRRAQASRAIFARVMLGLFAFEGKLSETPPANADVRRMWSDAKLPLPPRRFQLALTGGKEPTMSADGAIFPGGPALRLRLARGDAGCGASEWSVDRW